MMKKVAIVLMLVLCLVSLTSCGKYSRKLTKLKLQENIDKIENQDGYDVHIRICRDAVGISGSLRENKLRWLFIDGVAIAPVEHSQTNVDIKLSEGTHTLQIKNDKKSSRKSNTIKFEVKYAGDYNGYNPYSDACTADLTVERNGKLSLIMRPKTIIN